MLFQNVRDTCVWIFITKGQHRKTLSEKVTRSPSQSNFSIHSVQYVLNCRTDIFSQSWGVNLMYSTVTETYSPLIIRNIHSYEDRIQSGCNSNILLLYVFLLYVYNLFILIHLLTHLIRIFYSHELAALILSFLSINQPSLLFLSAILKILNSSKYLHTSFLYPFTSYNISSSISYQSL